jgi:hypothetical protein
MNDPGSARVPRAGEGVFAFANFLKGQGEPAMLFSKKVRCGETRQPACETRALPSDRFA